MCAGSQDTNSVPRTLIVFLLFNKNVLCVCVCVCVYSRRLFGRKAGKYMYVCMYVCMYVANVCTYVCVYVCMYVCM